MATPAIANLIREGKTYQVSSALQAGKQLGMHTMDQHLAALVSSGAITMEDAEAKAQDLDSMRALVVKPKFGADDDFFSFSPAGRF